MYRFPNGLAHRSQAATTVWAISLALTIAIGFGVEILVRAVHA